MLTPEILREAPRKAENIIGLSLVEHIRPEYRQVDSWTVAADLGRVVVHQIFEMAGDAEVIQKRRAGDGRSEARDFLPLSARVIQKLERRRFLRLDPGIEIDVGLRRVEPRIVVKHGLALPAVVALAVIANRAALRLEMLGLCHREPVALHQLFNRLHRERGQVLVIDEVEHHVIHHVPEIKTLEYENPVLGERFYDRLHEGVEIVDIGYHVVRGDQLRLLEA